MSDVERYSEQAKRLFDELGDDPDTLRHALIEARDKAEALAEALRRIAEKSCRTPQDHGGAGECPDHWAVGMSTSACESCIARAALSVREGGESSNG